MPHTSFITDGYQLIEKTVKPVGNGGAHAGAPVEWIGKKIVMILVEE